MSALSITHNHFNHSVIMSIVTMDNNIIKQVCLQNVTMLPHNLIRNHFNIGDIFARYCLVQSVVFALSISTVMILVIVISSAR